MGKSQTHISERYQAGSVISCQHEMQQFSHITLNILASQFLQISHFIYVISTTNVINSCLQKVGTNSAVTDWTIDINDPEFLFGFFWYLFKDPFITRVTHPICTLLTLDTNFWRKTHSTDLARNILFKRQSAWNTLKVTNLFAIIHENL